MVERRIQKLKTYFRGIFDRFSDDFKSIEADFWMIFTDFRSIVISRFSPIFVFTFDISWFLPIIDRLSLVDFSRIYIDFYRFSIDCISRFSSIFIFTVDISWFFTIFDRLSLVDFSRFYIDFYRFSIDCHLFHFNRFWVLWPITV